MRHQAITALTYLFLSRVHQEWRGEKPGADGLPNPHGGLGVGPIVVALAHRGQPVGRARRPHHPRHPGPQSPLAEKPPQAHPAKITKYRRQHQPPAKMRMATKLAL